MESNQKPQAGTRKLASGGLAGAVATIVVWLFETTTKVKIPPEVSVAIGTVVTSIFFYYTPEVYYQNVINGKEQRNDSNMNKLTSIILVITIVGTLLFSVFGNNQALAQTTNSLQVATYNVESPRPDDRFQETIPEVVGRNISSLAGPDIWGLSEVPDDNAAEVYRQAATYPGSEFEYILGTGGSRSDDLLAILYNSKRLELVEPARELTTEVGGSRPPLVAHFRLQEDGTELLAVTNHFNRGDTNLRNQQARNLRRWIEEQSLPVIALGDFNMDYSVDTNIRRSSSCSGSIEEGNEAFEIFTSSPIITWIRPSCLADGTCPPEGTGCFLPCFNSILDFVFIGGSNASNWTGTSDIAFKNISNFCENDPLGDSDHRPVLATLTFPRRENTSGGGDSSDGSIIVSGNDRVKITELFPNPVGGSETELESETVTLTNFGDTSVNLDGWILRDRSSTIWSLFGTLQPQQRIEFRRNGQPMALNNSGDTVELINSAGEVVDVVTYLATTEGEAIVFSTPTNPDLTPPDDLDDSDSTIPDNPNGIFINILPGEEGQELINNLNQQYRGETLGYRQARDLLYGQIDNFNGIVSGIYTNYEVRVNPNLSESPRQQAFLDGKGLNAEHVWPQSKGATGMAKSDLHILFPARVEVNSCRGNNPFDEIIDSQTRSWYRDGDKQTTVPTRFIDEYSECNGDRFEPQENKKGDVARAMFYFYTTYPNQAERDFFEEQREHLCEWHLLDPADAIDVNRSQAIEKVQGNQNPFVLDPTLASRTYCR